MFIRYTFLVLLSLLFVVPANSQEIKKTGGFARLSGMGANPYIVDPFFMTVNPAWGTYYDNFLFGDLGSGAGTSTDFAAGGTGQFFAANFGLGNNLTLGGFLSRNDFQSFAITALDPLSKVPGYNMGVVSRINNLGISPTVVPLNNNVELFGTMRMGRLAFGLGLSYASTTNEFNTAGNPPVGGSTQATASQFGINGGILADFTSRLRLDAGVSLIFPGANFKPAIGAETSVSETIFMINARLFTKLTSKVTLVPLFTFITGSGSQDLGLGDSTRSTDLPSLTAFNIGLGVNYSVGDFLLAGGLSLANASITTASTPGTPELSTSYFVFPLWNIGLEWNMTDWFVARLGYVATTAKVTVESPATQTPVISDKNETIQTLFVGPNGATVGVGFRFGDFSMDATVNEGVLRQGLNNIGGGGPTFAYLSVSYALP
ncbi:MAG: hypothetical protein WCE54_14470 [Ignavibacteriaceae bacterium]